MSQCRIGEADIAFAPKKYQLSQSQRFSQFYCAIARVRNFPRYKKVREPSGLAIGIDLGTTYCCVGVFQNGSVEVIANEEGSRITPSTVAFTARERLVGEAAQFQRLLDPDNVLYNAKRFIGRKFEDPVVQENRIKYPFKIRDKNNKVNFQVSYKGEASYISPEEVGAALLEKMKKTAEDFLGRSVKDAVVTVPAYFTDSAQGHPGRRQDCRSERSQNHQRANRRSHGLRSGQEEVNSQRESS